MSYLLLFKYFTTEQHSSKPKENYPHSYENIVSLSTNVLDVLQGVPGPLADRRVLRARARQVHDDHFFAFPAFLAAAHYLPDLRIYLQCINNNKLV